MSRQTDKVTDPRTLKVITHPLRLRLYEVLVSEGPATASRLSKYVPAAPGSLSYHLRQLAEYGYIEEAPELGEKDSRERWWRAVPGGVRWSANDFDDTPGAQEALASAQRVLTGRQLERLRRWQTVGRSKWGPDWASAAISSDSFLRLTTAELRELGAEIDAVLEKWAGRTKPTAADDNAEAPQADRREQVFLFFHAFPQAEDSLPQD
ncbi:helix-turn-helix domain-containing protein [Streptomyces microflavus]|uniref:ArsR/SmtB family transcription factor n=1 Tax=Streptomyces microflavus TaxID=1919 RepID=UPI002E12F57E|nr:helix-turn-helix domain-containing protein [Streptomyces microflavus]